MRALEPTHSREFSRSTQCCNTPCRLSLFLPTYASYHLLSTGGNHNGRAYVSGWTNTPPSSQRHIATTQPNFSSLPQLHFISQWLVCGQLCGHPAMTYNPFFYSLYFPFFLIRRELRTLGQGRLSDFISLAHDVDCFICTATAEKYCGLEPGCIGLD